MNSKRNNLISPITTTLWLLFIVAGFIFTPIAHAAPFQIVEDIHDPDITTHSISSGTMTLGISEYGGGYINQLILPHLTNNGQDMYGPTSGKYGRGGQSAIRDNWHGSRYNPTQAGFHDYAGTHCEIDTSTPKMLEIPQRPCAAYRGDGHFDFTQYEDLVDDLTGGDGGNSDADGLSEVGLSQADELTTEFDFYGNYEDVKGMTGNFYAGNSTVTIPTIRHYFEFIYTRNPGNCINQHDVRLDQNYSNVVPVVEEPASLVGTTVTEDDMGGLLGAFTLRLDRDVWTPQYMFYVDLDGDHNDMEVIDRTTYPVVNGKPKKSFVVYQNQDHNVGSFPGGFGQVVPVEIKPLLILADSNDPNAGGALGIYYPPSEINDFSVTGNDGYDYKDRRTMRVSLSDEPNRAVNMDKFGFFFRGTGIINPTRIQGEETFRGEVYILYGSPKQIYINAMRLSNQAPKFLEDTMELDRAFVGINYSGSLASSAEDLNYDDMTYSKVSGPNWLQVDPDGTLSGSPLSGDEGLNTFTVQVDALGGSDTMTVDIDVSGGTPVVLFSDGFESGNYSSGGWATTGSPVIDSSDQYSGVYCAELNWTDSITKTVSTVDMCHVELFYARKNHVTLGAGEFLTVEWSSDGTNWNLIEESSETGYVDVGWELPVAAFNQANLRVRFRTNSDNTNKWTWIDDVEIRAVTNSAPTFSNDPIVEINATENSLYSSSLADNASDPEGDELFFSILSGPLWLSVDSQSGALSGLPISSDVGLNTFTVEVTDGLGTSDIVNLQITVDSASSSAPQVVFTPEADSNVDSALPSTNYGGNLNLRVQTSNSTDKITYIRFNVNGGFSSTQSAILRLYSETCSASVSVYEISDNSWTENGITYNNAPSLGNLIDTTTCADLTWCEWDLSSYITGDGTYSIAVVSNAGVNDRFRSKEHANQPELVVTGVASSTAYAEADAFVDSAKPTTNYGSDTSIRVQTHNSTDKITYIRFNVNGGFSSTQSATLRLYSYTCSASVSVYKVTNNSWTESGITYNNAPTFDVNNDLLDTTTCADLTWCEWDLSSYITGDGTYTIAVVSNAVNNDRFRSKEHANQPELVVTGN